MEQQIHIRPGEAPPGFDQVTLKPGEEVKKIQTALRKRVAWVSKDHVACMVDAVDKGRLVVGLPPLAKHGRGMIFSADILTDVDADTIREEQEAILTEYISSHPLDFAPYEKQFTLKAREIFVYNLAAKAWWELFTKNPSAERQAEILKLPYIQPQAVFRLTQASQMNMDTEPNLLLLNPISKRRWDTIGEAVLVRLPKATRLTVDNKPVMEPPATIGDLEIPEED